MSSGHWRSSVPLVVLTEGARSAQYRSSRMTEPHPLGRRAQRRGNAPTPAKNPRRRTVDVTWELSQASIQAMGEVVKAGLELAPRPDDEPPTLPEDPTELGDSPLMALFAKYAAWVDYSATILGLAEVDETIVRSLLDARKDILLLQAMPSSEALRKRTDTMTRVRAEVDAHEDAVELQQAVNTAYARKKLASTVYERYERDWFVLSREITRRSGGSDPKTRRASRWIP